MKQLSRGQKEKKKLAAKRNPVKNQRRLNASSNAFFRFLAMIKNFFPEFFTLVKNVHDPRKNNKIYQQELFIAMVIMKDLAGVYTMRGMDSKLVSDAFIRNICLVCDLDCEGIENSPSYQTINNYLMRVSPTEFEKLLKYLVTALINSKRFYGARFNSRWLVILDGTGIYSSKKKLNDLCTKKVTVDKDSGEEKVTYQYSVLQAVLYLNEGLLVPIGCEFIGNDYDGESKQDCENKAAKRLLARIHKEHPRLRICIMGDALYATEPLMKECIMHGYDYLFRIKEGSQPLIMEDFRILLEQGLEQGNIMNPCSNEKGTAKYVNDVQSITGKEEIFNMLNYAYTDNDKAVHTFDWVTNIPITDKLLKNMVRSGRKRWTIENQGFRNLKLDFWIEHLCCFNETAMQNHYLIKWIAYVFFQVFKLFDKIVHRDASIHYTVSAIMTHILQGLERALSPEQIEELGRRRSYYFPECTNT